MLQALVQADGVAIIAFQFAEHKGGARTIADLAGV
jgi:hypothetical protein